MKFRLRTLFIAVLLVASVLMGIDNARMRRLLLDANERDLQAQRDAVLWQQSLDESSQRETTHRGLQRRMISVVRQRGQHGLAGYLQRVVDEEFPYEPPQATNLPAIQAKEEQADKLARWRQLQKDRAKLQLPEAPSFSASAETVKSDRPLETDAPSEARSYFENDEPSPLPED